VEPGSYPPGGQGCPHDRNITPIRSGLPTKLSASLKPQLPDSFTSIHPQRSQQMSPSANPNSTAKIWATPQAHIGAPRGKPHPVRRRRIPPQEVERHLRTGSHPIPTQKRRLMKDLSTPPTGALSRRHQKCNHQSGRKRLWLQPSLSRKRRNLGGGGGGSGRSTFSDQATSANFARTLHSWGRRN
jgi:hypothetical protein